MDIDRVRYFHVFASAGTLVKASEVLHISQPALSKAIKLLEAEVGAKLVESDGRGLRLTDAGKLFHKETGGLLKQWLELPGRLKASEVKPPTRIGSFEVFSTYFLGHLVDYVGLDELEVHEYSPGHLEQAIAEGVVDIGITYLPIPQPGIEFAEITKIKMGVFGLKKFAGADFEKLPFVVPLMPTHGTPSKVLGLDGWPDHKLPRRIQYRVTMMESALELCRRGVCAAYLPEFVVRFHNEVAASEFRLTELDAPLAQKERSQGVYLIQRSHAGESKLHKQLARALRTLR